MIAECETCNGTGDCQMCLGAGIDADSGDKCGCCFGSGECPECNGSGEYEWDENDA